MNKNTLVALAILKANWDERGESYLRTYVPFVVECIKSASADEISLEDIQTCLESDFGLAIPHGVVSSILRRTSRDGLIRPERGIYIRVDKSLEQVPSLAPKRADAARQLTELIDKFRAFAADEHGQSLSQDGAEALLVSYVDSSSVPILRSIVTGTPVRRSLDDAAGDRYILSAFIERLYKQDPSGFEALETMVKGSMLSAMVFVGDPGAIDRRFEGLILLLDTPVVLGVLGLKGESIEAARTSTLNLAHQLGADLRVLPSTVTEVQGVLTAVGQNLRSRRSGGATVQDVEYHFRRQGFSPSDVELYSARLEELLGAKRIHEIVPPPYEAATTLDEIALEDRLQVEVRYSNEKARTHDATAIAAVHRFRKGRACGDLSRCKAIFVTTNGGVVRAAIKELRGLSSGKPTVPLAIREHDFATLAWLKRPSAAPDLPRKQILANCFAALHPSDALWTKYLGEIEKLEQIGSITEADYYELRYGFEAQQTLMDSTLGEPDNFTEGTVDEILSKARAHARADLEEDLARMAEARDDESERREQAEARADAGTASISALRETQDAVIRNRANYAAIHAVRFVGVLVATLLFAALVWNLFESVSSSNNRPVRLASTITSGILLVGFALSAFGSVFGFSLRPALRRLETWLSDVLNSIFRQLFAPPEAADESANPP